MFNRQTYKVLGWTTFWSATALVGAAIWTHSGEIAGTAVLGYFVAAVFGGLHMEAKN